MYKFQETNPERRPVVLTLSIENHEQSDATTPLRWSIGANDQKELAEISGPVLLFVSIVHVSEEGKHRETKRFLFPLDSVMDYIVFDRPGKHIVRAWIVWPTDTYDQRIQRTRNVLWLKETLLGRYYANEYRVCIYDNQGELYPNGLESFMDIESLKTDSVEVNVGAEFFAKPPHRWVSRWVNRWHEAPPANECQFRARLIYSFTLKPILFLLWVALIVTSRALLATISVFLGQRGINFRPIIHPFTSSINNVYTEQNFLDHPRNNFYVAKKSGDWRPWPCVFLHPALWLGYPAAIYIAFFSSFFALPVRIVVGIVIILVSTWYINSITGQRLREWVEQEKFTGKRNRPQPPKQPVEPNQEIIRRAARYEDVVYENAHTPAKQVVPVARLHAIPPRRRTITLRYKDLKARVCKPFSRI